MVGNWRNFKWQKLNFYDNKVHRAQSYCPWLSKDQSNSKASLYLYEPCIIHQNHLLSKNSLKSPIYKNFTILAAVYINIHIADSKKVLFCGGGWGGGTEVYIKDYYWYAEASLSLTCHTFVIIDQKIIFFENCQHFPLQWWPQKRIEMGQKWI